MSQHDEYLANNPTHKQIFKTPAGIGDPFHLTGKKPSSDFRDRLKEIKKSHYKSTVSTW